MGCPEYTFYVGEIKGHHLVLAEDRDNNEICVDLKRFIILVGSNLQFMHSSSSKSRVTLKLYAEMVEEMLFMDSDAFVNNRIPDDLVSNFKSKP